jgi:hypothetical protein
MKQETLTLLSVSHPVIVQESSPPETAAATFFPFKSLTSSIKMPKKKRPKASSGLHYFYDIFA